MATAPGPMTAAAVALASELIAVDSVNPALVPGAAGERAIVALLADRLRAKGFETEVIVPQAYADRPSLLARHRGRGAGRGRSILLNGHLDTVGVGQMSEPFTPRIDDGRLYGRGACDMLGGIAAMVVAAEAVAERGHTGEVMLALTADEEHGSLGTDEVISHLASRDELPDVCLVGEPTWLELVVAHRGFAVVDVELRGRSAHSSRPHEGIDALAHLGRLITAVTDTQRQLDVKAPHPLAGHGSLMVTVASGGVSPFVVADRARATVERRTVPGESAGGALREVESILAGLTAADPGVESTATLTMSREAFEVADGDVAAEELMSALSAALPGGAARVGAEYWMESALWHAAGVSTVVCGPAGGGLHADLEWVEIDQLGRYAAAVTAALESFLRVPE